MERESLKPCTMLNPTPVVLISCGGLNGEKNMITAAWAGTVNSEPPMVSVSIRPERYSHHLISETGEFTVNLTDETMCRATDYCGVKSGRDTDKARETGLHYIAAEGLEYAPAVEEAPVCLHCRVRQVLPLGSHDMFIGEVIGVTVRKDLLDKDGKLRLDRAGLICYNHGLYQKLGETMGFFGWSVARKDVLAKRMKSHR